MKPSIKERIFCDAQTIEQRIDICKQCDEFGRVVPKFCGICSCFMPAKVALRGFSCPAEKWSASPLLPNAPGDKASDSAAAEK